MDDESNKTPALISRMMESLTDSGYPKKRALILHVSVSSDVVVETFDSEKIATRWMCWSIRDDRGEIKAPDFEMLSPSVDLQKLEREIPVFFPGLEIFFDDDCNVV